MLTRYPDWQSRLQQFLFKALSFQFAYGSADCCLFVADAVEAMTGIDIAAKYRGQYSSRTEALELAQRETGKRAVSSVIVAALEDAGLPKIAVNAAQRGDVVLVRRSGDVSLGIVDLNGKEILAIAQTSFVRIPLVRAIRAWR